MKGVIRATALASMICCIPTLSAAQGGVPIAVEPAQTVLAGVPRAAEHARGATIDGRSFAASVAPRMGPPSPRRQNGTSSGGRDSLWNGALLGAGAGAVLGAIGGEAVLECSACAGFNVPLTFGVIGAGVGAVIGAGIDALRHARSPLPVTPGRITVAPRFGKGQRAMVAAVRF